MAGIAGSVLGSVFGDKGAKAAAKAQSQAAQAAIGEQRNEFNTIQSNFAPYRDAGGDALQEQLRLLGLGDANTGVAIGGSPAYTAAQQQQGAIDTIKQGPEFTSLFNAGNDAILQNAAATGGLRGGNTNSSLAQFGSGLLNQLIQQRLSSLGGIAGMGLGATGSVSSAGQNMANSVSPLLTQQGNANATSAAAPYASWQGLISQLTAGGGGFSGLLSGQKNALNSRSAQLIAANPSIF